MYLPSDPPRGAESPIASMPSRPTTGDDLPFITAHTVPRDFPAPYRLILILAVAVFLSEGMIMLMLSWLPSISIWAEALIDACLITLIVLPLLHRFMLSPMLAQIAERKAAQAQVERNNLELSALGEAERHQRHLAEALSNATAALNSTLHLDAVLDQILEQTERVVPCPAMAILLFKGNWVQVPRHRGWSGNQGILQRGSPLDQFPALRELANSSRPLWVADTQTDPQWFPTSLQWPTVAGLENVRSLLLAPLVEDGKTIGYLATFSDEPNYFHPAMLDTLVTFANYAAVALHHAAIFEAELHAREAAETLAAASLALTQSLELQAVLDVLLDYLHRLIPYRVGSVAMLESQSRLVLQVRRPPLPPQATGVPLPAQLDLAEDASLQRLLAEPQGVIVQSGVPPWTTPMGHGAGPSWLMVPIAAGGRALGICCLEQDDTHRFTPRQLRLAQAMVSQAAVAIQNAWLFQQVRSGHDRLQLLSHRLVQIQENERLYVARELHDEAGQMLSSLLLGLKRLEREAHDPAVVRAGIQELRVVAHAVQENLHRLAVDLRPASLDQLGLVAALNAMADHMPTQAELEVQFKAIGWSDERLAPEVEVTLYRIAQEALTNVVRHAGATHVAMLLHKTESHVLLTIEDDGVGFDPEADLHSHHLGLVGMRERCEMLGGCLVVESAPGTGTTVVAEIAYVDSHSDL